MKRSLLALAALGTLAGAASAQTSVTLFGVMDVNARYVKNDDQDSRKSLSTDGINSSRLGFRGVEDLGGGLRAGFWLEAGVNPDTGTTNSKFFNRRSTVSLIGNWGELRLGRDYTPTFWNMTSFDPFGTNGLGSATNVDPFSGPPGAPTLPGGLSVAEPTYVRADNTAAYLLPDNLGGIYGWVQVGANEGAAGTQSKFYGGRLGYAAGPFDVVVGMSEQYDTRLSDDGRFKIWNIAGSWDFGVAKIMAQYNNRKLTNVPTIGDVELRHYLVGAVVPLGSGEVHASWTRGDIVDSDTDSDQFAIGYVYNLSKRTAVYGTVSRLANKDGSALGLPGGTLNPSLGGNSTGAEVGIRHFF